VDIGQAENLSRSFGLAARRCLEQRAVGPGQFEAPLAPAVVCLAFSIELGLKALILRANGSPWGHDLSELFAVLPESLKSSLVAAVGRERDRFEASLADAANAFEEWRYIYERKSAKADIDFLRRLQSAIESHLPAVNKPRASEEQQSVS
jgi:HEPN domain-containing protein